MPAHMSVLTVAVRVERNGTPDGEKTGKAWSMADSRKVTSPAISFAWYAKEVPETGRTARERTHQDMGSGKGSPRREGQRRGS